MKFVFGQKVVFVCGFYKGSVGIIVDHYTRVKPGGTLEVEDWYQVVLTPPDWAAPDFWERAVGVTKVDAKELNFEAAAP